MPKLTRRAIDALGPVEKRTATFDSELAGFGFVRWPDRVGRGDDILTGRRTWIVEYRPKGQGRAASKRRVNLGTYPAMMPEEAREAALKLLGDVRAGRDPAAEAGELKASMTVAELMDAFLKDRATTLKPSTLALYGMLNHSWITARLGDVKARELTAPKVARFHAAVTEGKGGKAKEEGNPPPRGGPRAANHAFAVLSAAFAWARRLGHVPAGHNPTSDAIKKARETHRERHLDKAELSRFADTLALAEGGGIPWPETAQGKRLTKKPEHRIAHVEPKVIAAIRLLLFTGARKREVLDLKWSEVDLRSGVLRLKDSKTGKKDILLSQPAQDIIKALPRERGDIYVFPAKGSKGKAPMNNFTKSWATILRHAEIADFRIHDLRHTFASISRGENNDLPTTGKLLGHRNSATTSRYTHVSFDPLQTANARIAERLVESGLSGRTPPQGGDNVVTLRREVGR